MSSKDNNLSEVDLSQIPSAEGYKVHIAVSDWNSEVTHALLEGAVATLKEVGVTEKDIEVVHVPGTFELPLAAKSLFKSKASDAVICLGCVIKGETDHDVYINQSVANAINQLAILSSKPVIFGVLTVNTHQQALDRCGGVHGNKGVEAAVTAVKMIRLQKDLNKPGASIGF